jgi:excisionase family DNA binding protein
MNKKDAAAFLGVSLRTLENHSRRGRLSVKYVKGPTGDRADFDERELRVLRDELDADRAPRPSVVREPPASPEAEARSLAPLSALRQPELLESLLALAAGRKSQPRASVGEKMMLSPAEAAALAGLSENFIRAAMKAGKLKAKIYGRGYKIKRTDLDAYVKKL